ncbi:tyrosine-type recombinase/integrase [Ruoffia sp. FAM 20858]|uniref:site-specific integrase n=1 Tax=Ruoffia sp. FAM 20858 TaxID=3259516 RepID=UPI003887A472
MAKTKIKEYKLKDGSTRYQFQLYLGYDPITGKQKNTTRRGFKSVKEARLAMNRLELNFAENGFQDKRTGRFEEVYELWLESVYIRTVKASTLNKTYELFKNHILPAFGHYKLEDISVVHCQETINEWCDKLDKYRTLKNYVQRVLDYGISMNYITDNPMKKVIVPKRKEELDEEDEGRKQGNFFSKAELNQFLTIVEEELSVRWFAFFRLLAYSGARKGELLALDWKSVDFEQNKISLSKTLSYGVGNKLIIQTPKTRASVRSISIDAETMVILKRWKQQQAIDLLRLGHNVNATSQVVFTTYDNNYIPPANTTNRIRSIVERHELPYVTCHGLRHTHCSLLFESGASIREVKDRLGHKDIATTMNIYDHVQAESREATADKFAEYMSL